MGDSYGTFLMPIYAARHPEHVRSIVLDGALSITQDPWGREVLRGARRVIGLVCRRTNRCSGARVLSQVGRLAGRLRRHPVHFTAHSPVGAVRLTLGERELANLAFGFGDPRVFGLLPAAVDAARRDDFALLERMVGVFRIGEVGRFFGDPSVSSIAVAVAVGCHDYPRPYDLAVPVTQRQAEYARAFAALDRPQFRPFSPAAWLSTDIEAGPKCLDWPVDPTAGSPLRDHRLPDVLVLVQSGELDTNTPVEQGRRAAAQFRHPILAEWYTPFWLYRLLFGITAHSAERIIPELQDLAVEHRVLDSMPRHASAPAAASPPPPFSDTDTRRPARPEPDGPSRRASLPVCHRPGPSRLSVRMQRDEPG